MDKKRKIILGTILVVAMLLSGFLYYRNFIRVKNVFDQMYYTMVQNHFDWWGGNRTTLFGNMEQLVSRDPEVSHIEEGFFIEMYKNEYLEKNQSISIDFIKKDRKIVFSFGYEFPETDERMWLTYSYDIKSKRLLKEPVTIVSEQYEDAEHFNTNEDDINDFLSRHSLTRTEMDELHEWFLYDRILADWFDANGNKTRFSLENLGRYTFVDGTNNK